MEQSEEIKEIETKEKQQIEKSEEEETKDSDNSPKLTKSAMKRKLKEEKRLQMRLEYRKKEKEHKKERKRQKREQGLLVPDPKKIEKNLMKKRKEEDIQYAGTVVIDASFDDKHTEKDTRSLGTQIQASSSANRRALHPFHLWITSYGGKLETQMQKHSGMDRWKLKCDAKHYTEVFGKESLVYLSSEATEVLTDLDPSLVYVIGGLVDHNRFKGLTHRLAVEQGIRTARLPIEEHLSLEGRKVLAVNHVMDILLAFYHSKDWTTALHQVIPPRKNPSKLNEKDENKT